MAVGARGIHHTIDVGFFGGETLLAAFLLIVAHRVVKRFALLARQRQTCAHTGGAPTVFAVVAEEARVKLRVAGTARGAGAFGGEHLHLTDVAGGCVRQHGAF